MLLFEKFERRKNPLFKQGKIPSNKLLGVFCFSGFYLFGANKILTA